jgi:hypothetical protein
MLTVLCLVIAGGAGFAADVVLVHEGRPQAQIVIAEGAREQVKVAAGILAEYLRQASGATVPLCLEAAIPAEVAQPLILVGQTRRWPVSLPAELDGDGFVITARDNRVSICGPTDWGTEFGVYEFLERYVGVRWLLPGPQGTDVPSQATIRVPEGHFQDQPVFFSRQLSGHRGAAHGQWGRFNREHGRVKFHHNLVRLFPAKQYAQTHPEFYPLVPPEWRGHTWVEGQAQRYLPQMDYDENWQPCLTAPGIVEEAASNIIRYFNENPGETSYSLGMNDSGRFCLCDQCRARISGEKNYLGWMDYSDLYYDWCNQVIERVLKVHPDKWFGCLAYFNVATPPRTVKVHPRLVPYITLDRMKWLDPKLQAAGHEATRQWQQAVPTFAWYDYIYGTPYLLPRMYVRHTADYLRFGADHGVKAHYAEIYFNFGEGPKPYVHLRLWWNPRQDVEALEKEWYERCVGPEAAPYLAQYYALWERFWTQDVPPSPWFQDTGTWLPFQDPGYLALVKIEDLTRSRQLLEQTIARTKTDKQQARAEALEKAFQYYEASALAYLLSRNLPTAAATEEEALTLLEKGSKALEMAHKRQHLATVVYPQDPLLIHGTDFHHYHTPSGVTWGAGTIWAMANWVRRGDNAVRRRVAQLAQSAEAEVVREQATVLLRVVEGRTTPVNRNGSFEEGEGEAAAGWSYWLKPDVPPEKPIGHMGRSREVAHTGDYSLLVDGAQRAAPLQTVAFPGPGKYAITAWVYVPADQPRRGFLEFVVASLAPGERVLATVATRLEPVPGEWSLAVLGFDLAEKVNDQLVHYVRLIPTVNGYEQGGKVYFDDLTLHRLE